MPTDNEKIKKELEEKFEPQYLDGELKPNEHKVIYADWDGVWGSSMSSMGDALTVEDIGSAARYLGSKEYEQRYIEETKARYQMFGSYKYNLLQNSELLRDLTTKEKE